jgi:hypothetical protein
VAHHSLSLAGLAALLTQYHGEVMAEPRRFTSFTAFQRALFGPLEAFYSDGFAGIDHSVTLPDEYRPASAAAIGPMCPARTTVPKWQCCQGTASP